MRAVLLASAVIGLISLTGCTAERLRQRMVNQGATLPELQYQQVLDNLALFAANPDVLPWHVNLREGTSQVTDSASVGAAVDLGPPTETLPQIFGTRTAVAQWGGSPVIDPLELRLLRVAYRRANGSAEMPDADMLDELAHVLKSQVAINTDLRDESELFFEELAAKRKDHNLNDAEALSTNDDSFVARDGVKSPLAREVTRQIATIEREMSMIGGGWFHVGHKHDVPGNACYVGHYRNCWVWITEDGRGALTEFTLTVMRISTLIKETQTLISPGSVKFSPGDRGG
ncbi:MAG TPA: hypothetical protein VL175_04205 [Pirellulales bacterium]|jgi:hypothetical protein|nr:hypothetical protein [Pirellulales bacterium]